jgi:hypothetical protein
MAPSPKDIDTYLDELLSRLRGPAAHVRRTLAEAEAHLRDAADAEIIRGVEVPAAERKAIERFGSPRQVAAAANRQVSRITAGRLAASLTDAAAQMLAVGIAAIGIAALAARGLAAVTSEGFV